MNCEGGVAWKWVLSHILGDSDTAGFLILLKDCPDTLDSWKVQRLSRYVSLRNLAHIIWM